jgi:thioredoxin 1
MERFRFLMGVLFMLRTARSAALLRNTSLLATSVILLAGCSESGKTVTLTAGNFEEKVLKSKQPVLVDFWAEWCGPCKMMDPVIKELAAEYEGKVVVAKVNADDYPEILQKYGIEGLPTFLVFRNGELRHRIVGGTRKQHLSDLLGALQ